MIRRRLFTLTTLSTVRAVLAVAGGAALYPLARLWIYFRHRAAVRRRGCCPVCLYNLTGNTSGVCPECGTPVRNKTETAA